MRPNTSPTTFLASMDQGLSANRPKGDQLQAAEVQARFGSLAAHGTRCDGGHPENLTFRSGGTPHVRRPVNSTDFVRRGHR
jgi:hypothetical protein